jgi:hypothetical protein
MIVPEGKIEASTMWSQSGVKRAGCRQVGVTPKKEKALEVPNSRAFSGGSGGWI